jgi:hypothetical protein
MKKSVSRHVISNLPREVFARCALSKSLLHNVFIAFDRQPADPTAPAVRPQAFF